jgi:antitoxin HigA-1
MTPKNRIPTHPGEILLAEFLRPMEVSQARAAAPAIRPIKRAS